MDCGDGMIDVAIVGGGPAGSALAVFLGRQGLDVALYDQARFPREKPCGEGLLPAGVEVLRQLGLAASVGGRPLFGVRYHVGERHARAGFSVDAQGCVRHGIGQRRARMDRVLWDAAAGTPGVAAQQGVRVSAPLIEHGTVTGVVVDGSCVRARWVVAADGSHSTLRRQLDLERTHRPLRVGVRSHFRLAAGRSAPSDIQIFLRRGYEIYVTPLPQAELLVALLSRHDVIDGSVKAAFSSKVRLEPLLSALLDGAEQVSEISGRSPLLRATRRSAAPPRLTFLGDASTAVDPITAGGMSLALVSARLLSRELPAMLSGDTNAQRRFEHARDKAVRIHRMLGGCLLSLGTSPLVSGWALSLMRARRDWMEALVDLAATGPNLGPTMRSAAHDD